MGTLLSRPGLCGVANRNTMTAQGPGRGAQRKGLGGPQLRVPSIFQKEFSHCLFQTMHGQAWPGDSPQGRRRPASQPQKRLFRPRQRTVRARRFPGARAGAGVRAERARIAVCHHKAISRRLPPSSESLPGVRTRHDGWGADRLMEGFLLGRRECSTTDAKRSLRSSANLPKIPEWLNRMVCELDAKGRCQEAQM